MSKKSLLIEFCNSPESRGCRSIEELESRFYNWMVDNNKRLVTFGKDYFNNEFENSVDYTIDLLEKDPSLLRYFGFNYNDLERSKINIGYYERKGSRGRSGGSTAQGRSRTGTQKSQNRGTSRKSASQDEGYSFMGQLRSYADGIKSQGRGKGGSFSLSEFIKSPLGILIAIALIFTFIYIVFGEAIYSFITSGAIFKVICFAIAGLASFGIIRSKNLGWPIYIKALVLFAVWVVLLNYDF